MNVKRRLAGLGKGTQIEGIRMWEMCVHSVTDSALVGMFQIQEYVDNYRSSKHEDFDINRIIKGVSTQKTTYY
jgi:hypothetical protein